jgi:hypothetical protein
MKSTAYFLNLVFHSGIPERGFAFNLFSEDTVHKIDEERAEREIHKKKIQKKEGEKRSGNKKLC